MPALMPVRARRIADSLGVVMASISAVLSAPLPSASAEPAFASAQPCPDAEVVFARGTTEQPGLGPTGQAFVDSLRAQVGAKSIGEYAVDYPASLDFATAVDGIDDASAHVKAMSANCPKTKLVLGGFSQGAAVMGFVTADVIPDGVDGSTVPAPMPPDVANHVAAVALLGKPNNRFMNAIDRPLVTIGPLYAAKTIDLCIPEDPVCSSGRDIGAHMKYVETGTVDQAATFAASRLQAAFAQDAAPASPPGLCGGVSHLQSGNQTTPPASPGCATAPR
jgi:cutinase